MFQLTKKEKPKTKWAAVEALVGDPKRIALDAADLVAHFEKRLEAMDSKAMIASIELIGVSEAGHLRFAPVVRMSRCI